MNDEIKIVQYLSVHVGDRPGEGRRILEHVSEQGISLLGFAAFPLGDGQTELSFITDRTEKLRKAAADAGMELHGPERAFLISGEDQVGSFHRHHLTLANAGVNVRSAGGTSDGKGHYHYLLFVEPVDFDKAATAFDFD